MNKHVPLLIRPAWWGSHQLASWLACCSLTRLPGLYGGHSWQTPTVCRCTKKWGSLTGTYGHGKHAAVALVLWRVATAAISSLLQHMKHPQSACG